MSVSWVLYCVNITKKYFFLRSDYILQDFTIELDRQDYYESIKTKCLIQILSTTCTSSLFWGVSVQAQVKRPDFECWIYREVRYTYLDYSTTISLNFIFPQSAKKVSSVLALHQTWYCSAEHAYQPLSYLTVYAALWIVSVLQMSLRLPVIHQRLQSLFKLK